MQLYNNDIEYYDTNIQIDAFSHILVPFILENHSIKIDTKLFPPYDIWGDAKWKILQCNIEHSNKSCLDYCLQESKRKEDLKLSILKNFNTIFGVTRNKQFANAFRAKKAQVQEEKEEEEFDEEENEDDDAAEDDDEDDVVEDESSSSEDDYSDEDDDNDENNDEEEDDDDDEDNEQEKEEETSSISSSSSSEKNIKQRKRK